MNPARIDIQPVGPTPRFSLVLKRNCSIAPQALATVLGLTACLSFGIGIGFATIGAWPILPFAGLEIAALAAAFYVNGRHAADYERIAFEGGMLVVEVRVGERTHTHRFNPHWVRLVASGRGARPPPSAEIARQGARDRASPGCPRARTARGGGPRAARGSEHRKRSA